MVTPVIILKLKSYDDQFIRLKGLLNYLQWEHPTILFEFEVFTSKNIGTLTFFGVPGFEVLITTHCKEKSHNQKLGRRDFPIRRQEIGHILNDRRPKSFLIPSVPVGILIYSPLLL